MICYNIFMSTASGTVFYGVSHSHFQMRLSFFKNFLKTVLETINIFLLSY